MKITGISSVYLLSCIFVLTTAPLAAKAKKAYKVKYSFYANDKKIDERSTSLIYFDGISHLSGPSDKIKDYIDFDKKKTITILNYQDELFKTSTPFDSLPQPQMKDTEEELLDYKCQYATFSSFSNTIEVWYTTQAPAKGSPYKTYIPDANALVLKVRINKSYMYQAESIDKLPVDSVPVFLGEEAREVSMPHLQELIIKSRYTSLSVFKNQQVHFDPSIKVSDDAELVYDSVYYFSKGSVILKRIKLPELWKKGAKVFATLKCSSNGDAYDRVGSVFVLRDSDKPLSMLNAFQQGLATVPFFTSHSGQKFQGVISDERYETPLEVMRFATSFGVGHFNTLREINNYPWFDEAIYKEEVTQIMPKHQDEIIIGVFIGNYDKGGHKVSLDLDFYPDELRHAKQKQITKPLFYTVNVMEMSGQNYGRFFSTDTLTVRFMVDKELSHPQLIYTTTGHGGWGGGDEFNPKLNQIFLDGKEVYSVTPWRTDCATYRLYNPASGNFSNGMSSSDLSRSNWCPATLTPPYFIPLVNLTTGMHEIKVVIDQGEPEGNSFSHWCISGVLTGTEEVN